MVSTFILSLNPLPVSSGAVDWVEVSKTIDGRQCWGRGSLIVKNNGNITLLSKYQKPLEGVTSEFESKIFIMEINCTEKVYRDNFVNGIPQVKPKWISTEDDLLVDEVVNESCSSIVS